jgi:hypothetical protein
VARGGTLAFLRSAVRALGPFNDPRPSQALGGSPNRRGLVPRLLFRGAACRASSPGTYTYCLNSSSLMFANSSTTWPVSLPFFRMESHAGRFPTEELDAAVH